MNHPTSPRLAHASRRLALLIAWVSLGSAAEPAWRVGLASTKITPEQPLMLAGYAARVRPFERVEADLFAKAVALEDATGARAVLVTCDIIGFPATVVDPICARIAEKTGLKREQIVINASHIHTGPTLDLSGQRRAPYSEQDAKNTAAYTHAFQDKLVELATRALVELAPARLSWGVGVAHFAMNRREFAPGRVRLGVNPRGPVDRSVPVLRIDSPDGTLRGVLFGYACHNTTLTQSAYIVSADYAGYAQAFVQQQHPGAQAMFVIGLAGDADPYPRGTIELARQHGTSLGAEVCRVLGTKLQPVRGPLRCAFDRAALPVRPVPRSELEHLVTQGSAREKEIAAKTLARDRGEPAMTAYPAPIAVWQFGPDLTFVALSGEVVVDFVPLIEKAIGPLQLWLNAYSHDVSGYIPSSRVLAEGGYETRGLYTANALFTPETETVLVAKVRELSAKAGRRLPE